MAISTGTAIALGLTALASGATAYNTKKTTDRQNDQIIANIQRQNGHQREADARTGQMLDRVAKSSPEAARTSTLDRYLDQIRQTSSAAQGGLQQAGATSSAYRDAAADASLGIGDYAQRTAGLLARMDAPALQRQQEAVEQGRYGADIDRIRRFSAGDDFLGRLRMQGIQRNTGLDFAAGLAGAGAGAAASYGQGSGWDEYLRLVNGSSGQTKTKKGK